MLSVLILTKDEEENVKRAIRSIKDLADQIIVLDCGSEDRTVEIAREMGAEVHFRDFDSYPSQLNAGLSLCRGEWIFILDADEEVSEPLRDRIKRELQGPRFDVYRVCRKTYYLGDFLSRGWYPEWRVRLFRKGAVRFEGYLHEVPLYDGSAGKLKGDLYHYSFSSLKDHLHRSIKYVDQSARFLYQEGKRATPAAIMIRPLWTFIKFYILKRGFMEGKRGLVASSLSAFQTLAKYLLLTELEMKDKKGRRLWKPDEGKEVPTDRN